MIKKIKKAINKRPILYKVLHPVWVFLFWKGIRRLYFFLVVHNMKRVPKIPQHFEKEEVVKEYADKFSLSTLIETGTFKGKMIGAMKDNFDKIYSIELSEELYNKSKEKFSEYKHITILNGDSGKVLNELMKDIKQPCLFWLDAHYSRGITAKGDSECPIFNELKAILDHEVNGHVILIDDDWGFGVFNDWPKISEIKEFLNKYNKNFHFEIKKHIIVIY